jgi:chromosome segregation ATPase
MNLRKELKGS